MRLINSHLVVLEPGCPRESAKARIVQHKFDSNVYPIVMKRFRQMYFDRWGILRMKHTHMPVIRMIVGSASYLPTDYTLTCVNGDRFDYQRHNWIPTPKLQFAGQGANSGQHRLPGR